MQQRSIISMKFIIILIIINENLYIRLILIVFTMKKFTFRFFTSSQSIINRLIIRFAFCATKQSSPFTDAVISGHRSSMKIIPCSADFSKYSWTMYLTEQTSKDNNWEWVKDADVQTLSTSLQFVWRMSYGHSQYIVGVDIYKRMLQSYYHRLYLDNEKKIANKIIHPDIEIKQIVPSFIHTNNRQILQMLKLKQFSLVQLLAKSRPATIQQIIRVINPSIYNVTDLPLLHKIFLKYFYPQIGQIKSVFQLQKAIVYLSKFESIPIYLINHSIVVMKKQLSSLNPQRIDAYLSVGNIISLLYFKAHNSCRQAQIIEKLANLQFQLSNKPLKLQDMELSMTLLQDESTLNQVIERLTSIIIKKINSHINALKYHNPQNLPPIVNKLQQKHLKFLNQMNIDKIKVLIQLQLIPKIIKYSLTHIQLKINPNTSSLNFIDSSIFLNFIKQYPCYPDIYKQFFLTLPIFEQTFKQMANSEKFNSIVSNFKSRMNFYLNHTLKDENDPLAAKCFSFNNLLKTQQNQSYLWLLQGQSLASRLIQLSNEDFSFANMLGMLKKDNQFMRSRMRYNKEEILTHIINQKLKHRNWSADTWDYPIHYSVKLDLSIDKKQQQTKVTYDRFTKETLFPNYVDSSMNIRNYSSTIKKAAAKGAK